MTPYIAINIEMHVLPAILLQSESKIRYQHAKSALIPPAF